MRQHRLSLFQLVDEDSPAIEKCWRLMRQLGISYTDLERALADRVPGEIR
jgi:hypothetical protein